MQYRTITRRLNLTLIMLMHTTIEESLSVELGDNRGAIQDYNKAIELDPDDAAAYNNRGMLSMI